MSIPIQRKQRIPNRRFSIRRRNSNRFRMFVASPTLNFQVFSMIRRDFVTRIIPGATVLMMADAVSAGAPEPLVAVAGSAWRPKVLFFDVRAA